MGVGGAFIEVAHTKEKRLGESRISMPKSIESIKFNKSLLQICNLYMG